MTDEATPNDAADQTAATIDDPSPEVLAEEVERLRRERDQLAAQVERVNSAPERRHRTRRILTPIVVVLTVLALVAAVPGTWLRRTFVDQDRYVATATAVVQQPAVQAAVAREVTQQVFAALDVQGKLSTALNDRAPRLVFLAGPITNAVEGYVQTQVNAIVASPQFEQLWVSANEVAHEGIITMLEGQQGGTVVVADGKVVLNLLPLINEALSKVSAFASDIAGHPIQLPTITGEMLTSAQVDAARTKIEQATGVSLPQNFGQITLVESSQLGAAQDWFRVFNRAVMAFVVLFLLGFVVALLLSTRRRRTLIQLVTASAVVLVVERRLAIASVGRIVDQTKPENQSAVKQATDVLLSSLLRYTGWLLLAALLTLVVALVTGPYPWAVRMRSWVAGVFGALVGTVSAADDDRAASWIGAHRDLLMMVGALVAVAIMLLVDVNVWWFLALAILLAVYELVVYRVALTAAAGAAVVAADGDQPPTSTPTTTNTA